MKNFYSKLFLINLFFISSLFATVDKDKCNNRTQCFEHNIQLQLFDFNGFPVENTKFWVALNVLKRGPEVTLQLPVINFQTGQISSENPNPSNVLIPGGYLYTVDGFLPANVRPVDLVPRSVLAGSNNGLSPVFSFTQTPSTLPEPPVGYIVQVTNAGALQIQGAETFENIIPAGPQIMLPIDITYLARQAPRLLDNRRLSTGLTSTVNFTSSAAANNGVRDSHVCDADAGIAAWAWCDNSNIKQTINTLNVMVSIGTTDSSGKLTVGAPIQITNFPANVGAWDTAIAINRTNPDNIVVSYGMFDYELGGNTLCRAVSFDRGVTWGEPFDGVTAQPFNGPLAVQPAGGFGDARGVASDNLGTFWYSATANALSDAPLFYTSTNQGVDFNITFTAPTDILLPDQKYDYPQFCFGFNATGEYGLYYIVDIDSNNGDSFPSLGFLPITGTDLTPTVTLLPEFTNTLKFSQLTSSPDGRVWMLAIPNGAATPILPIVLAFKSPGSLNANIAGAWDTSVVNLFDLLNTDTNIPSGVDSQPVDGFIQHSVQSIIYDEGRKALYALCAAQTPDDSQNMRIFFIISRDNGMTWSAPIDISTTDFANRGFQSMALDTVTGNLIFGWYDGRNDPSFTGLDYFCAILPAPKLDALVNRIPTLDPEPLFMVHPVS